MQELQKDRNEQNLAKHCKGERIPETWAIETLGNIVDVRGRIGWRGLNSRDYRKDGPLFIGVTNISRDFSLDLTELTRISEERYNESPEIIVHPKDILLAKSGATTGKVCFVEKLNERATVNAAVNILRCKEGIVPKFLFYFLTWHRIQKQLFQMSSAGAQPNLFQRDTRKLRIILPTIREQQKIASILSKVDELIQKTDQVIEQTQRLKRGLMQRLLTKGIGHTKFKRTQFYNDEIVIPKSWSIVKLRDNTLKIGSGITPRGGSKVYGKSGIPLIRSQNVHFEGLKVKELTQQFMELAKRDL